jgi:hypothetical protein
MASAAKAKQAALDRLKAKPPVDEALAAQQREAWQKREEALAAERAEKAEAKRIEKEEKAAAKAKALEEAKAAAELKAARLRPPSPAAMKAARDARYAARQARTH